MVTTPPRAAGLYNPRDEHDACGVGFVVDIKGRRSHDVIAKGLQILLNLLHRGACGCEANTGDGAGVLIQMPDRFLRKVTADLGFTLPPPGAYAAGLVFLPQRRPEREQLRQLIAMRLQFEQRGAEFRLGRAAAMQILRELNARDRLPMIAVAEPRTRGRTEDGPEGPRRGSS